MNQPKITFEKASPAHEQIIFNWLSEPHMMEFWDNTQEHKDDILNFIHNRKQHYFYGTTKYWVGSFENHPFAFILTDEIKPSEEDLPLLLRENLSKTGKTIVLDFGIGNKAFLGKGLAALTLKAFIKFYAKCVDQKADTYFIDPDEHNPRAIHVYQQAGFQIVGKEEPATKGGFIGQRSFLMVQTFFVDKENSSNIRFANTSDAEQIAICHVASWQKIYRGHIPDAVLDVLSVKEREQKWRELLNSNVKVLVIERNNNIIGFASLCPSRDKDTDPKTCGEISAIYLHPDFWNQGLGKKLCHAALKELETQGFSEVIVWVLQTNEQARSFYSAMGFTESNYTKQEPYNADVILNEVRYQKNLKS